MSNRNLQLQQDRKAAVDGISAILAKLDTESRSAMTPEEKTALAGYKTSITELDEVLAAQNDLAQLRGNIHTDVAVGANGLTLKDNAEKKPWGPEATAGETKREKQRRMEMGFGEFLTAVRKSTIARADGRSSEIDVRLSAAAADFEKRAAAAGSSESVPSDGGFLIYPDFSEQLLELVHDTGVIYTLTRELPISEFTNSVKIPAVDEQSRKDGYRNGGIQMFWENEAQSLTGSKPTFNQIQLTLKKLTGLYYATDEVLADARLLGNFVMKGFSQEMGFKLDDGVIRGTGAGQLAGILNSPALITIAKEAGQAAATVTVPNLYKMWGRMWTPSRNNAVWLINQDVEQQLNQLTIVGTGGVPIPVFIPAGASGVFGSLSAPPLVSAKGLTGLAGYLFGRPVFVVEQASTIGTVGDIILADFQQFLMMKKDGLQTASSMHVRFLTDEMTYRWIYRTDGQPWWKTQISPYQGTNTLSPFVVLAAR